MRLCRVKLIKLFPDSPHGRMEFQYCSLKMCIVKFLNQEIHVVSPKPSEDGAADHVEVIGKEQKDKKDEEYKRVS